ncbi:MAG: TPM domain-containing protein [Candidatus Methanomethylicaceae archaeon]
MLRRGIAIFFLASIFISSYIVQTSDCYIIEYEWVERIENYARLIDAKTSAEIVVCVLPSLYGHGITDHSGAEIHDIVKLGVFILNEEPLEVYDGVQTGIGKRGKDNGVLILITMAERQWRIEVGYGLEGYITDIETNLIAQKYLVPYFHQGNYGEGLYKTVVALGDQIPSVDEPNNQKIRGYYYYEGNYISDLPPTHFWEWEIFGIPLWVIIIFVLFGILIPVSGRSSGRGGGRKMGGRSGGGGAGGRW